MIKGAFGRISILGAESKTEEKVPKNMTPMLPLKDVEDEILNWISQSTSRFKAQGSPFLDKQQVWVMKFIPSRYLSSFLQSKRLSISTTAGFTWGDGLYVTPLCNPYSTMMYGRVGVLGWIDLSGINKVFDASTDTGIRLYQNWIQYSTFLFRQLTTTIHSNIANRILRNRFRRRFVIDLVVFPPDQFNRAYVDRANDRWFVVSDWTNVGSQATGQRPTLSSVIRDCEWVAIVQEDFGETQSKTHFKDLLGPHITPPGMVRIPGSRPNLAPQLTRAYAANRTPGGSRAMIISISP